MFEIALHIRIGKENVYRFREIGEGAVSAETFYTHANMIEEIIISLPQHRLVFATGLCQERRKDEEDE